MTDQAIQTDNKPITAFNEQAEKVRLLEILLEEEVSENVANSFGLLPEYRERRQLKVA